jgi:hypothetical protein
VVVSPGVGKSHLAVALGMKACEQGVRTLFVSATALITTLGKALAEGKLEDRLKLLSQPQLLIIDEIEYLLIDRQGANLFFQLVSRRYERGSIIITSNQSLGAWGEVFGDRVIASAILDRLLHHSITVNIKGESFRLKEKTQGRPAQTQNRRTTRNNIIKEVKAAPLSLMPLTRTRAREGEFQLISRGDFRMMIDICYQIISNPVAEVFLLAVIADVGERQYRD